jgi:hypothetical protein
MSLTALFLSGVSLLEHVVWDDDIDALADYILEDIEGIVIRCADIVDDDCLEIQLIYRTPGLKAGALASAAAILIWILLALVRRRRQRQEKGRTGRPERSRFSG